MGKQGIGVSRTNVRVDPSPTEHVAIANARVSPLGMTSLRNVANCNASLHSQAADYNRPCAIIDARALGRLLALALGTKGTGARAKMANRCLVTLSRWLPSRRNPRPRDP